MRRFNGNPHLIVRHQLCAGIVARRGDTTRGHEFDEIRAALLVLANATPRFLRGVHTTVLPTRVPQLTVETITRIGVPRRGTERLECDIEPRSRNLAVRNGVAE